MRLFLPLVAMALLLCSCEPSPQDKLKAEMVDSPTTQDDTDKNLILQYVIDNNMAADIKSTASGIYYTIENPGTGDAHPDNGSFITAHYTGKLLDGTVFDSSVERNQPLEFPLGQVIPGWQETIPLLKKGGKGKFIIPSKLAYGPRGAGQTIGPNTVLTFEVELLDFEDQAAMVGKQKAVDQGLIEAYIAEKGLTTQKTESGIHYIIEKAGKGDNPTIDSEVTVHYHGTLLDGTVFDSSVDRGETISFPLKQVVPGWQEAIPLLKKGGKGKFIIPSDLAYGGRAQNKIPANSVLIFDVELFKF